MAEKVVIGNAELWHGDCREVLPLLTADVVITDPPYLDGDLSHMLEHFQRVAGSRVVVTPGKFEAINWIRRPPQLAWQYAWKCSGTKTLGGAACFHILWEPVLAYCFPVKPLGSDLLDFPLEVDPLAVGHPWPKPLKLMRALVEHWSKTGETVLDAYLGSGTTGVAAVNLGRSFVGIERERKYFDIACERIQRAQAQGTLLPPEPAAAAVQSGLAFEP